MQHAKTTPQSDDFDYRWHWRSLFDSDTLRPCIIQKSTMKKDNAINQNQMKNTCAKYYDCPCLPRSLHPGAFPSSCLEQTGQKMFLHLRYSVNLPITHANGYRRTKLWTVFYSLDMYLELTMTRANYFCHLNLVTLLAILGRAYMYMHCIWKNAISRNFALK